MKKDNFLNLCLLWTESCFRSILVVFFSQPRPSVVTLKLRQKSKIHFG